MTARCRVPSRAGARVPCGVSTHAPRRVSTRVPCRVVSPVPCRVGAQLAPSSHPSGPHNPCSSHPLSAAGLRGSQQFAGEGWRRRREEIAQGEEWGLLPVPASPGCPPQPSSRGNLPCFIRLAFTWQKDLCRRSGLQSLLLPQVGKTRTNSGAARRGKALAQQAKS